MTIRTFHGKTFVAWLDISGFKELMRNAEEALKALDKFYQIGYDSLKNQNRDNNIMVEGLFISDAGILFVREGNGSYQSCDKISHLIDMLVVIQQINKEMINANFMLTSSIAFGKFDYEERIEFEGIDKNLLHGYAYVNAYLDNEKGTPKIQPGQCRIIKKNLPQNIISCLETSTISDYIKNMIKKKKEHYYYYWNLIKPAEINKFEKKYNEAQKLKYRAVLQVLKKPTEISIFSI